MLFARDNTQLGTRSAESGNGSGWLTAENAMKKFTDHYEMWGALSCELYTRHHSRHEMACIPRTGFLQAALVERFQIIAIEYFFCAPGEGAAIVEQH